MRIRAFFTVVCLMAMPVFCHAGAEQKPSASKGLELIADADVRISAQPESPVRATLKQRDFQLYTCILNGLQESGIYDVDRALSFGSQRRGSVIRVEQEVTIWILSLTDPAIDGFVSICRGGNVEERAIFVNAFLAWSDLAARLGVINRAGIFEPWQALERQAR